MEAKGGEVRRVHVVYFLSRMGRIEHPHLIRVHHCNRTGVRLRDVKRWLADLRGTDMPDSFAWSYKRRYKTGYVWQDLLDDDLITAIADNEYVLKGSEISSSFAFDSCISIEKATATPIQKLNQAEEKAQKPEKILENKADDLSEVYGRTVDSKVEGDEDCTEGVKEEKTDEDRKGSSGSGFGRSRSFTSGGSHVFFRNLLNCGAVETNDSAMVTINRGGKTASNNKGEICKAERLGGSQRILGGPWNGNRRRHHQQQNDRKSSNGTKKASESADQKTVSSVYKPVAEPYCSQCGKGFKPEKLHTHMKSCKGLKNRMKGGGAEKLSQTDAKEGLTNAKEATPGLLLAH